MHLDVGDCSVLFLVTVTLTLMSVLLNHVQSISPILYDIELRNYLVQYVNISLGRDASATVSRSL